VSEPLIGSVRIEPLKNLLKRMLGDSWTIVVYTDLDLGTDAHKRACTRATLTTT
jgi:hypothetical protein